MIFLCNSKGTITSGVPDNVYQGSNFANEIILVAPFPAGNQVTAAFILPNGTYTTEQLMTYFDLGESYEDEDGLILNAWRVLIGSDITSYSGTAQVQFRIYSGSYTAKQNPFIASYTTNFTISQGVPVVLPSTPASTIYQQILNNLAIVSSKTNQNATDIEKKLDKVTSVTETPTLYGKTTAGIQKQFPVSLTSGESENTAQIPSKQYADTGIGEAKTAASGASQAAERANQNALSAAQLATAANTKSENAKDASTEALSKASAAETSARQATETANNALEIAKGSIKGVAFADYQTMIAKLNGYSPATNIFSVGQPFYIRKMDVPDLWVYRITANYVQYNYTTDDAFLQDLLTNGYVQIGSTEVAQQESKTSISGDVLTRENVKGGNGITVAELADGIQILIDSTVLQNKAQNSSSIAIGRGATSSGMANIVAGYNATSGSDETIAMGKYAYIGANLPGAMQFGHGANDEAYTANFGGYAPTSEGGVAEYPINKMKIYQSANAAADGKSGYHALATEDYAKKAGDGKYVPIVTSAAGRRVYTVEADGSQSNVPATSGIYEGVPSVVLRANGRAQIAAPLFDDDIANKKYVDEHSGGATGDYVEKAYPVGVEGAGYDDNLNLYSVLYAGTGQWNETVTGVTTKVDISNVAKRANKIVMTGEDGKVETPPASSTYDAVPYGQLSQLLANKISKMENDAVLSAYCELVDKTTALLQIADSPIVSTIVSRTSRGTVQGETPTVASDLATKAYVDSHGGGGSGVKAVKTTLQYSENFSAITNTAYYSSDVIAKYKVANLSAISGLSDSLTWAKLCCATRWSRGSYLDSTTDIANANFDISGNTPNVFFYPYIPTGTSVQVPALFMRIDSIPTGVEPTDLGFEFCLIG